MTERVNFAGWAILELMGHRRLGGYVTEQEIAGTASLRIDVPSGCTGVAASWCPRCGDCTCKRGDGDLEQTNPRCPLHGADSHHVEMAATQFYSPSAVYAITPTTEEMAAAVALRNQPEPVHRWELPQLEPPQPDYGSTLRRDEIPF